MPTDQGVQQARKNKNNTIMTGANAWGCRMLNARVIAHKTKEGDWVLTFTRVSKNDWTKKQKKKFDVVIERMGIIYTKKYLRLSPLAVDLMFISYSEYFKTQQK